jgi:hypothetical protein
MRHSFLSFLALIFVGMNAFNGFAYANEVIHLQQTICEPNLSNFIVLSSDVQLEDYKNQLAQHPSLSKRLNSTYSCRVNNHNYRIEYRITNAATVESSNQPCGAVDMGKVFIYQDEKKLMTLSYGGRCEGTPPSYIRISKFDLISCTAFTCTSQSLPE